MHEHSFRPDLTGSDESLEDLLSRLKVQLNRTRARPGKVLPPEEDHFFTSRRPKGGAGAAEAPIPKTDERRLADCFAY